MEDTYLRVGPACAHLSNVPFNGHHPWGAWRNRRSFVGTLSYGVRHLLWQPERKVHSAFPAPFREMVRTLLVLNRHSNSRRAVWSFLGARRSPETDCSSVPLVCDFERA